jgi:ribose transport system substrate-binding protein
VRGNVRARYALATLGVACSMAFGVTACGGDDESDSASSGSGSASTTSDGGGGGDAQATAKAAIDKAKEVPQFDLEAESFDASKASGMTVFNIPVSSAIPYVAAVDKEMQKVAKERGIRWVQFENQGNPTQWASGMNQAISQKADLIILDAGIDPKLLIPQLRRAKSANIKVLVNHLYQNGEAPDQQILDLIDGYITVPFHESGELSVQYAVADGGCDAVKSTLIINAKEVPPSQGIVDAMTAKLAELCPDAKPKVVNVPVVDWGTKIAPEVQSALSADPNMKWVLPIYDSMSIPAIAGIRAAGKAANVKVASYNGTPDVMKLIESGDNMAADMGENIEWLAYANMDQAMRILTDGPIIKDGNENTPLRVFDDSNVKEAGAPEYVKGFGTSYIDGYKKLWGVQ